MTTKIYKKDEAIDRVNLWPEKVALKLRTPNMINNNVLEKDKQEISDEKISRKNAFKIRPKKGVKFTQSIIKELKNSIGCRYDSLYKAYVCPINSKDKVSNLFNESQLKVEFTDVFDVSQTKSKKINGIENSLEYLQKKVYDDYIQLIGEISKYDPQKHISELKDPPNKDNFTEDESEERKNIRFSIEMDLHKRYLKNKEDEQEVENLRNSLRLHEKETEEHTFKCGDYIVDETGLYYYPENKKDNQEPVENNEELKKSWISSPIWPEAYLRDSEGRGHSVLLKMYDGERYHLWAMPRRIIGKWQELSEVLLDLGQKIPTNLLNQKHLQNFLMFARPEKSLRCVDKAGWHSEQYVFPDGEVIGKGVGNEGVYPVNEACPKGVKQKGKLKDWQENTFKLCIGNSRLIFSVGTALSAPCLEIIGEDSGGFNFKGRSSIGKTKCLKAAVSVFGSPDFRRSWKTTANGLEGVCALHNDCLLPLDEFGQSDAKEAGEISYMVSQGIGKQRASRDGSAREPKTWRVMILSTGEVGLEEHMRTGKKPPKAGQMARVADIPAEVIRGYGCFETIHDSKDGADFADELDRQCKEYYGTAGREFVKKLVDYGIENARKDLRFLIDDFVADHAKDYNGQVKRVARRFGLVFAALSLAIKFGVLGDNFKEERAKEAIKQCYLDWLGDRGTTGDIESHSIIEQVSGLLNENSEGKFAAKTESLNDDKIRQTLWGYREGAKFYVFPKAFKVNLCEGHDPMQAAKMLIDAGMLIPDSKGKSSRNETIQAHHKRQDRFYVIDLTNDCEADVTC